MGHSNVYENRGKYTRGIFWQVPTRRRSRSLLDNLRARLHGGGGPQVGVVTRLGGVTHLFI